MFANIPFLSSRIKPVLVGMLLVSLIAAPAAAASRKATVMPGKETRISVHSSWTRDCKARPAPKIVIVDKPQHGSLSIRSAKETVERKDSPCKGKTYKGSGVFYKASKSFHGTDHFIYRRIRGNGRSDDDYTVKITVK